MWTLASAALVPRFPVSGPLRTLAIGGTVSLLAFLTAAYLCHRQGRRGQTLWAVAPAMLALASVAMGRLAPALHPAVTVLTLLVALRNVAFFRGAPRILEAIGAISWVVSVFAARALFA